jgi:hypothetical protein
MKVIATITNGLAISPRDVVFFKKGDVLEVGKKKLTEDNLAHLVRIGFATPIQDDANIAEAVEAVKAVEAEEVAEVAEVEDAEVEKSTEELPSFETKEELEEYATARGVALDKRNKSLAKMLEDLKDKLGV